MISKGGNPSANKPSFKEKIVDGNGLVSKAENSEVDLEKTVVKNDQIASQNMTKSIDEDHPKSQINENNGQIEQKKALRVAKDGPVE